MTTNKVARAMHSLPKELRARFDQTGIIHRRREKGGARGLIAQSFLNRCLPQNATAAAGGEITTPSGLTSPQCDVLIFDWKTPKLLDQEGFKIIPSECTLGVIEVKSKLDKKDLIDACNKIQQIKKLPKEAYSPTPMGQCCPGTVRPIRTRLRRG